MKTFIVINILFSFSICRIFAQKSPIKFLNNTCTIHVDTTNGNMFVGKHLIDLKYRFVNTGDHVAFIDSARLNSCITKPKDTSILVLKFDNFFHEGIGLGGIIKNDTSSFMNIPFYYEGKIYYEKIICKYTFGKSMLIEYDKPFMLVNDTIAKRFTDDNKDTITRRYPDIRFTKYYTVKNKTNKPIWCTKRLIGFNDTDIRSDDFYNYQNFVMIPPHTTYKIPVEMHMGTRYWFSKSGNFIVCSEDIFELHAIAIKSDFAPKGKYTYK